MLRRNFLQLTAGSALAMACTRGRADAPRSQARPVRAVAFDLLALFDPRGVDARCAAVLPAAPAGFAATWKTRLFDYCFLRTSADRYLPFDQLVRDSLEYATRVHHVELTATARTSLERAFTELEPWPDTAPVLRELHARGLRLAPLANFAPHMIRALLQRAALEDLFETELSTDRARTYKPDPRAYALAETAFHLSRPEIAFVAFAGWDAAGGRWYGYPTFWINRTGASEEVLIAPDASGPDLHSFARWLSAPASGEPAID
jgi:2-haloacid dehalogenase